MTEQEKRRRRREMERRMRAGNRTRGREMEKGGGFSFRLYVTAVLVGGCFLISLFDTATAQTVCGRLREMVSYQISAETLEEWRGKAMAFLREREIALPTFGQEEKEKESEEKIYLPDTEDSP